VRRPAKRAFSITLVGFALIGSAITAQAGWLFVLAAGVLALVVASLLYPQRLKSSVIERSAPQRVRVGDEVRVGVSISNPSRRSSPAFRLEDRIAAFEPIEAIIEPLHAGARAEVETVRTATRRGVFEGGSILLTSGAPFGFVRARREVQVESPMTVVPAWIDLKSLPLLEPSSSPSELLHERARIGAGEEYHGVRDYRPGDPMRFVHWRSSARTGHLMVREYEEHVASRVALVVAGSDVGKPPESAFETLVSAAASIALYALVTGHPVTLLGSDAAGSVEAIDDVGRMGVLDWLASVRSADTDLGPLVTAACERVGRRGTVVVCSTSSGVAGTSLGRAIRSVQAAGSRAVAIVAAAESWAKRPAAPRGLDDLGRAHVRYLSKGEELARCLQG
jgi:uncharacterized protein (DUF58 family)